MAGNRDGYTGNAIGRASLFDVRVKPGSTAYRYDVSIETERRNLVRQADKSLQNKERTICYAILRSTLAATKFFGTDDPELPYVYDGRATLYTASAIQKLASDSDQPARYGDAPAKLVLIKETLDTTKYGADVADYVRHDKIVVTIQRNDAQPLLDYSDFETALSAGVQYSTDRSTRNFIELVTSQPLVEFYEYTLSAAGVLFEQRPATQQAGMVMLDGLRKGARIVDKDTCHLVVDMHRSAFYATVTQQGPAESLYDIYRSFGSNHRRIESMFRGVRMRLRYAEGRTFVFGRLTDEPLDSPRYFVENRPLADYFEDHYDVALTHPDERGVYPERRPGGVNANANEVVYPLELVEILPGVQVPQERSPQDLENSVDASQRFRFIEKHVTRLTTGQGQQFLAKWGIEILTENNRVTIWSRPLPRIQLGGRRTINVQSNGSFFRDILRERLLQPTDILADGKWVVAHDERLDKNLVRKYIKSYINSLQEAGVRVQDPEVFGHTTVDRMFEVFHAAHEIGARFILYVDQKFMPSHTPLKLYEAYYKILTQQVAFGNLERDYESKLRPQTLKNVALKTNMKGYGLNYVPVFDNDVQDLDPAQNKDLLIIGLDVAHPTRANGKELKDLKDAGHEEYTSKHPSVVGIVANKEEDPYAFTGDFFYQESLQEQLSARRLQDAVAHIVLYAAKYKGTPARRIILFRDGISEGQYDMALRSEIPAVEAGIKKALDKLGTDPLDYKLTFIVATKRHHKRFFRQDASGVSNTRPGDVIFEKYVRTDVPMEFFLQSHNPIKGMPKMVQITVLRNDQDISRAKLERFLMLISNMHQVSACPTALCLPVYMADETAARGYAIYNELCRMRRHRQGPGWVGEFRYDNQMFDVDELSEWLGYRGSELEACRWNA